MQHRRAFRAAHDELELLTLAAADGNDEAAADLELLVERGRDLGSGSGDGDRGEGRVLGQTERPVADVDLDSLVTRGGQGSARMVGKGCATARAAPATSSSTRRGTRLCGPCCRRVVSRTLSRTS